MLVIVGYLLIGIAAFWPVYPISQRLFSGFGDYTLSLWFLDWVPHALTHGLNPFFSNAIFVPTGVNLAQNTESPLLGLITAPFALAFSPVLVSNVLMVLAMPVSASAAFVVLRRWHVWLPAAALGGLVYGFSPYMVGQSLAHVVLVFLPLPPFIASTVVSILRRQGSTRRLGIQLGLLVTAQFLISPEVLTTVILFAFAAVACVMVRYPARLPEMARAVVGPAAFALAVAVTLLAYPVWMMLAGPQHFIGANIGPLNHYYNDLLSFVVPGRLQKVSLGMGPVGTRLTAGGDPVEAGAYIGVPLLALTGILAWRSRRSTRMQLTVVLLCGAALLSLGPHLAVDGSLSHIPLPFLLLDHIPLLNDILPTRICFELGALLAAVIAFGLDDVRRAPARGRRDSLTRAPQIERRRGAVFAGVILAVLVTTQLPRWPLPSQFGAISGTALPTAIRRAVPTGDPVAITYPYDTVYAMQPMLWQAEDGFGFRLLGGYSYHREPSGYASVFPSVMEPQGLQQFLVDQDPVSFDGLRGMYGPPLPVNAELVAATRATLSRYHVRLVIVDRSVGAGGAVTNLFDDSLGSPKASAGQFSLWADWHGSPRHQVFEDVNTSVFLPLSGAKLKGTVAIATYAVDNLRVTSVNLFLTDGMKHSTLIGAARPTLHRWTAKWNTTAVANGTYTLQSVACDSGSRCGHSTGITITIENHLGRARRIDVARGAQLLSLFGPRQLTAL
ncbi:MAG: Ig-like domain-containing protein [Acidimicrobiales bacterium]